MLPTGTQTCQQALCRALANGLQACQIYKHWCRACKALRCWQWMSSIIICIHTWVSYACCSFQLVSCTPNKSPHNLAQLAGRLDACSLTSDTCCIPLLQYCGLLQVMNAPDKLCHVVNRGSSYLGQCLLRAPHRVKKAHKLFSDIKQLCHLLCLLAVKAKPAVRFSMSQALC